MVACLLACFSWGHQPPVNSPQRKQRKEFLDAAKKGDVSFTKHSLDKYPDIVKTTTFLRKKSALHLAAESGHLPVLAKIVEFLVTAASVQDAGEAAVVTPRRSPRSSPRAATLNVPALLNMQYLLRNGADRSISDSRGNTPLHYSTAKGYLDIMTHILGASGDATLHTGVDLPSVVNARNAVGFSSLHFAVWAKQTGAVQVLVQHGADILARNTRVDVEVIPVCVGCTALHLAAYRGHVEISRILIKNFAERVVEPLGQPAGAPLSAEALRLDPRLASTQEGQMAYQLARRLGHTMLSALLRPNIPINRLFTEQERNVRYFGPLSLKTLCAEALNKHLCNALDVISAAEGDGASGGTDGGTAHDAAGGDTGATADACEGAVGTAGGASTATADSTNSTTAVASAACALDGCAGSSSSGAETSSGPACITSGGAPEPSHSSLLATAAAVRPNDASPDTSRFALSSSPHAATAAASPHATSSCVPPHPSHHLHPAKQAGHEGAWPSDIQQDGRQDEEQYIQWDEQDEELPSVSDWRTLSDSMEAVDMVSQLPCGSFINSILPEAGSLPSPHALAGLSRLRRVTAEITSPTRRLAGGTEDERTSGELLPSCLVGRSCSMDSSCGRLLCSADDEAGDEEEGGKQDLSSVGGTCGQDDSTITAGGTASELRHPLPRRASRLPMRLTLMMPRRRFTSEVTPFEPSCSPTDTAREGSLGCGSVLPEGECGASSSGGGGHYPMQYTFGVSGSTKGCPTGHLVSPHKMTDGNTEEDHDTSHRAHQRAAGACCHSEVLECDSPGMQFAENPLFDDDTCSTPLAAAATSADHCWLESSAQAPTSPPALRSASDHLPTTDTSGRTLSHQGSRPSISGKLTMEMSSGRSGRHSTSGRLVGAQMTPGAQFASGRLSVEMSSGHQSASGRLSGRASPPGSGRFAGEQASTTSIRRSALAAAEPAGFGDEDGECGVCLEHLASVSVLPCRHNICGPCARQLCSIAKQKVSHCPFCRTMIASFAANGRLPGPPAGVSQSPLSNLL